MIVTFTKSNHSYNNEKGDRYTSATQLIERYTKPFNAEYWSTYKALKDVLTMSKLWRAFKAKAGGWEATVAYYKAHNHPKRKQIEERKKWYLDQWKLENQVAVKKGSHHHDALEKAALASGAIRLERNKGVANTYAGNIEDALSRNKGVYAELLLWNHEYRIAGQADLVEIYENEAYIKDYKTCKEISREPFMDKRFLEPLTDLFDTKYNHYTLQLSIYGWMLEQRGFSIGGLNLYHIDRDSGKLRENMPIAYRRDWVERLLEHHKHFGR